MTRIVILEGTSFERGRQHGEALRAAIHNRVERHQRLATHASAVHPRERTLRQLHHHAAEVAPDLMSEVEGIAHGCGLDARDIFMLNAFEADGTAGGCTALAAPRSGGAIIAQNWDGAPDDAADLAVMVHVDTSGVKMVMLTSAGGLGWAGISSRGLAVLTTDLLCSGPVTGLVSQFTRRLLLASADLGEALANLTGHAIPGGRTYLLGDRLGRAAMVEVAPGEPPRVELLTGPHAHANHAHLAPIIAREDPGALERTYPSSRARERRAATLLGARTGWDGAGLASILADHDGRPLSICKHASAIEPSITVASLVFDLERSQASVAVGAPCLSDYVEINVGSSGSAEADAAHAVV